MRFNEFEHNLIDMEAFFTEINTIIKNINDSENSFEVETQLKKFHEIQGSIMSNYELASIRYSKNTQDIQYEEAINKWNKVLPIINSRYLNVYETLVNSACYNDFKISLPKSYRDYISNKLRQNESDITNLQIQEGELIKKYRSIISNINIVYMEQDYTIAGIKKFNEHSDRNIRYETNRLISESFKLHSNEIENIFSELVKIRNEIAHRLGFANYHEYSFIYMNRVGYGAKEVSEFRDKVIRYLVPIIQKFYTNLQKQFKYDELFSYDLTYRFLTGVPELRKDIDVFKGFKQLFDEFSNESKKFIEFMEKRKLYDLYNRKNKISGAYSTYFPNYKSPYVFTNCIGSYGDIKIIAHEFGHALQAYLSNDDIPEIIWGTPESCEIHSISMEVLMWPWLNLFFDHENSEKYKINYLIESLELIAYGCLIDHFQEIVYINPQYDKSDRRLVWEKLEKLYNPWKQYSKDNYFGEGTWWLQQHHIFTLPFYYIDYSIAQISALENYYKFFIRKEESVIDDYLNICKGGGRYTYKKTLQVANLSDPFNTDIIEKLGSILK